MTDFTEFAEKFGALAAREGFSLTPGQTQQFARYAELLEEWNQKMNLTAIRAPEEVAVKHFIDSLLLLRALPLGGAQRVIDVGTGAGFPGVPLLIARPGIALTLLDSLQKRLRFLEEACAQLGLHAKTVHARAEEAGRNPAAVRPCDGPGGRAAAGFVRILPAVCQARRVFRGAERPRRAGRAGSRQPGGAAARRTAGGGAGGFAAGRQRPNPFILRKMRADARKISAARRENRKRPALNSFPDKNRGKTRTGSGKTGAANPL